MCCVRVYVFIIKYIKKSRFKPVTQWAQQNTDEKTQIEP